MTVIVELLASLWLALASPPSSNTGLEAAVPAEEATAKQLFAEARYPEAAVRYESLWSLTPTPKYLFNAAMARELAGHEAHAYLHLLEYLALNSLAPAEIEKARARMEALKQRTAALRLIITPTPDSLRATLELKVTGAPTDIGRVPLTLDPQTLRRASVAGATGTYDLYLEPGTWNLAVAAPGYVPERPEISVAEGEKRELAVKLVPEAPLAVPLTVRFGPTAAVAAGIEVIAESGSRSVRHTVPSSGVLTLELPAGNWMLQASAAEFKSKSVSMELASQPQSLAYELEPLDRVRVQDSRARLAKGLKIGGTVTAAAGLGLAIVGGIVTQPSYDSFVSCNGMAGCYERGVHRDQWRTLWLYDAGALLAGAGAGATIYGAILGRDNARTNWRARLGTGAALASLGLIVGVATYAAPNGLSDVLWDRFPDIDRHRFRGILAADMLGFALAGSGIALMALAPVERRFAAAGWRSRTAVTPRISLAGAGVDLKVRF